MVSHWGVRNGKLKVKKSFTCQNQHRGQWEGGKPTPSPQCVNVCLCVRAYTFTALKPNKHCPSASQGKRTAVSFRNSSPMAVQETVSHQLSEHVSMTQMLGRDWETTVQPQFTTLSIVPVTILCLTKTAYSDRDHFIHNRQLLTHAWCSSAALVKTTLLWARFKSQTIPLRKTRRCQNKRTIHSAVFTPPVFLLPAQSGSRVCKATDWYNTRMWLSGQELEGAGRRLVVV